MLSDVEQIRLRPGLFIASTASLGMHRLLMALVEAPKGGTLGHSELIEIVIHNDNSVTFARPSS